MKLHAEPFEKIKSGAKIYELRLYDEKRRQISVGDFIEFTRRDDGEKCLVKVIDIAIFDNFSDLYSTLPLSECGYSPNETAKATPADMEKYYPKSEQQKYGAVAIKIALV